MIDTNELRESPSRCTFDELSEMVNDSADEIERLRQRVADLEALVGHGYLAVWQVLGGEWALLSVDPTVSPSEIIIFYDTREAAIDAVIKLMKGEK